MNCLWRIVLGVLAGLGVSFWGLVAVPQRHLGHLTQIKLEATDSLYPQARPGPARRGAEVYRALGCVECHTQQVRPRGQGSDFQRGWGQRRTVAQDYLHDYPVLLGAMRIGPDLANIGARQPEPDTHLKRLYDPRLLSDRAGMPSYAFLFQTPAKPARQPLSVSGEVGATAHLSLFPAVADPRAESLGRVEAHGQIAAGFSLLQAGRAVVPNAQARDLVAYLLSLRSDTPLFEAPVPAGLFDAVPEASASPTNHAAAEAGAVSDPKQPGQVRLPPAARSQPPNHSQSSPALPKP